MHKRTAAAIVAATAFLLASGKQAGAVEPPSTAVKIPSCYMNEGPIYELVPGAERQVFAVSAKCPLPAGQYFIVWPGGKHGIEVKQSSGGMRLELRDIPEELPSGFQTFAILKEDDSVLVNLAIQVQTLTTIRGSVTYSYDVAQRPRDRASEMAGEPRLPIAIVNPSYAYQLSKFTRTRRAPSLTTAAEVDAATAADAETAAAKDMVSNQAFLKIPPALAGLSPSEWRWSVTARDPGSPERIAFRNVGTGAPREISYVINQEQNTPVRAQLTLEKGSDVWLQMSVSLASMARAGLGEPLPISNLLYVACKDWALGEGPDDIIDNGGSHAISDGAMAQGRCALYVDPCNERPFEWRKGDAQGIAEPEKKLGELRRRFNLYGTQLLAVSVERQGVSGKWEVRVPLEPSQWECKKFQRSAGAQTHKEAALLYQPVKILPLSVPPGDAGGGEAMYLVQVQGAARTPTVQYASGTVGPGHDDSPLLSPDYQFTARLRPPGLFGFPYYRGPNGQSAHSVRMFITVPVDGVAFRFPASLQDVHSTTDNTKVQILSLRAGVLLTIEPWDYNRGANFFAVPLRFQAGMHLVDLGKGRFTPSTLVGISAALPLIDSPSKFTQTSAGIGLFWENDLRDRSNHFLLTIGLNLLSLFSPPASSGK